jgi:two-component system cell cycle sensor histidine kinase/response regulator CckA
MESFCTRKGAAEVMSGCMWDEALEDRKRAHMKIPGLKVTPPAGKSPSVKDLRSAVEKLHVYEAELETQNEELLDSRAQIEESQKKYFRHFDLAPVGLIRLDRQGLILEANILGAQMLGEKRVQLNTVPRTFLAHVSPASHAVFQQHLESALVSGKMETCELSLRNAAGHETFVRIQSVINRGEKDETDFYITLTDLTEHREIEHKLETQLLRAQRLESIGTLASGVAHDLNNTLVPILMAAPVLRDDLPKQERLKFLDIVESSAQRGAQIVRQVLSFARGAAGDHLLLQPIYVLAEITKIIEETFSNAIRVRTSYPENLWLIDGDPTQLHQVLLNLCVNARDAMPEGGHLSLIAENFDVDEHYATITPGLKPGPHVLINVIDSGSGISPDIIDKIFDPFFTTKEPGKGTGLGLSTVLGIVKSHGGALNVRSSANGTTFRVFLPAAPGARSPAKLVAQAEIPTGHGETILLVDDEIAIREVAKAVLSQSGYKVLTADDGPSAVAIFEKQSKEIATVLTDSAMPMMSGLTLARALRRLKSETKIILSTARESDYQEAELSNVGLQAYLNKPYTREALLRTVDRVLRSS